MGSIIQFRNIQKEEKDKRLDQLLEERRVMIAKADLKIRNGGKPSEAEWEAMLNNIGEFHRELHR